eukprot:712049-Pelagomonas_calceolata.AAC.6
MQKAGHPEPGPARLAEASREAHSLDMRECVGCTTGHAGSWQFDLGLAFLAEASRDAHSLNMQECVGCTIAYALNMRECVKHTTGHAGSWPP